MKKNVIFIIVILIILWICFPGTSVADIPVEERNALIELYNNTNGDNWTCWNNPTNDAKKWKIPPLHTDGFSMPGTECGWNGVLL